MRDPLDIRLLPNPILSARERGVLEAGARGMTDKQIALALGIAAPTIRVYRKRAEEKLGVKGVVLCLLVAWRLGEIDLDALAAEAMVPRNGDVHPM